MSPRPDFGCGGSCRAVRSHQQNRCPKRDSPRCALLIRPAATGTQVFCHKVVMSQNGHAEARALLHWRRVAGGMNPRAFSPPCSTHRRIRRSSASEPPPRLKVGPSDTASKTRATVIALLIALGRGRPQSPLLHGQRSCSGAARAGGKIGDVTEGNAAPADPMSAANDRA